MSCQHIGRSAISNSGNFNRRLAAATIALACTLAAGPALAGPPFETDDPEPVQPGHWEVYTFTAGAIGSHDATGLGPSLEVNYGAAPNLQLHLIATTAYDAPGGSPAAFGIGDTELGMKYRFINPGKDDWYPEVGIFPLVELPTGKASRNLGAGHPRQVCCAKPHDEGRI